MDEFRPTGRQTRRTFLAGAAALVAAACTNSDDEASSPAGSEAKSSTTSTAASAETTAPNPSTDSAGDGESGSVDAGSSDLEPLTPAAFDAVPICTLAPSQGAGPFPSLEQFDRRDITEGYPGHPFRLGIRVVDQACQPIPGARVEIWHTDVTGDYSSYEDAGSGKDEGAGTTFLRGFQTADDDGILEFHTIYPGWYDGRAVHIHAIASVDGEQILTTQLYFDEAYTETVMTTGEYAEFGPPDTSWADDGLIGDPATDG
ncbi:MAG: hypothetical protein AAFO29_27050, partial [Actinomycetota bacterium]